MQGKAYWRNFFKEKRSELSKKQIAKQSELIVMKLIDLFCKLDVKVAHVYLSMGNEVDTNPLIDYLHRNGITVATSKTLKGGKLKTLLYTAEHQLESGLFGTEYPVPEQEFNEMIDLIVTPVLGFDYQGNRIGYGGGYYDRFLNSYPKAIKVGVGFSSQLADQLPSEVHDIKMDYIVTPEALHVIEN